MPDGRMIAKSISFSEQFDDLINEAGYEAALFLTWMIPHLDREGRIKGSEKYLQSRVCPLRKDITSSKIASFITKASELGILVWYEENGEKCIWFPRFHIHQRNMRKEREAESVVPEYSKKTSKLINSGPAPDQLRTRSGPTPPKELIKEGIKEVPPRKNSAKNSSQKNKKSDIWEVVQYYEKQHPDIPPYIEPGDKDWKRLVAIRKKYSIEQMKQAIDGNKKSEWWSENRKHSIHNIFKDVPRCKDFINIAKLGEHKKKNGKKKDVSETNENGDLIVYDEWGTKTVYPAVKDKPEEEQMSEEQIKELLSLTETKGKGNGKLVR